jgi:adenosylhomocysteine nucleosidase
MAERVDVAVLTALDLEYAAVRGHLTGTRRVTHQAGTVFETGTVRGTPVRVALAVAGEGNQAAAVLTERTITLFHPAAVFVVGIAGALHPGLALGDVVVATRVYAPHGGKDEATGLLARPRAWDAPHELEQPARHLARTAWWQRVLPQHTGRPCAVHFKPVVAGEVVLGSRAAWLAEYLRRHYNDAVAVEMESAGAAHAAHLNRAVPVLTVRGISDRADENKAADCAAGWPPVAAAHAAAFTIALIERIAADQPVGSTDPSYPPAPTGTGQARGTVAMHATASGQGRVYQAAGDQYIFNEE